MQFWNDLQTILDVYNSLHHFKPLGQPIRFHHLFPKSMKRDRLLRNRKKMMKQTSNSETFKKQKKKL
jgi:hypothetical protein